MSAAPAFSFKVDEVADELLPSGAKAQYEIYSDVAVRRPDRIISHSRGDFGEERLFFDGLSLVVMDFQSMRYQRAEVVGGIDGALDHAAEHFDLVAPLADLVYSDPYRVLSENLDSGEYLGIHQVRGRAAHHLRFTQQNVDWQIWVADDREPLPLKVVINYKSEPGQPQFIAWLSGWKFSPYLPDSVFQFTPPDGALEYRGDTTESIGGE